MAVQSAQVLWLGCWWMLDCKSGTVMSGSGVGRLTSFAGDGSCSRPGVVVARLLVERWVSGAVMSGSGGVDLRWW